jgi:NET1-associated nuclear protein 1 (U3 small nucleolar RNA-associated protein 17)
MDKQIEDQSNGTQERCVELCKIGGHDLTAYKPVFTSDSKYLLISSGNQLRRYVVESGAFFTSHYFGHQNDIISVQINPQNSDEVIITSNDGLIIVWNLNENRKVNELNLILNKNYETVIWSQLVSNVFYFLIVNKKSVEPKCQLFYCPKNLVQQKYCINNTDFVNQTTNSVAFGPTTDPRFCASIYGNCLNLYEIPVNKSSQKRRHFIQEDKEFTCVVCHPNEDIIASGDSLGRIILWHNFMDSNFPSRSIMHWHNLPVSDLCFSPEGTYLYSVGAEMTLVRWNITGSHCGHNNFMPRLGMPIKYVTIDSKHHMIATSHDDNCIQILGPQMNGIRTTIEGLSLGIGKDCELSTGLLWNNKLNAIALNGRTGHLQFYSPSNQKQLFQLDIVNMNLISSTKEQIVFPTEVTKAAISDDGNWLSTIELRDDYETLPEIRLKFWLLNQNHSNFFLNTTIHLPHKSDVNYVQFSPKSNSMVSTSNDKDFKIWNLNEDEDKKWWKCSKVANLNNISIPTIANWSSDSSLLAIAFDNFITLWDVSNESNLKFMTKISVQDSTKSKLIFVGFGNENKSHYLIEGRHFIIRIWNLLDFSRK